MKKIMIYLLLSINVEYSSAMETDFIALPIEDKQEKLIVGSLEALAIIAQQKSHFDSNDLGGYDVKPQALSEYFCVERDVAVANDYSCYFCTQLYDNDSGSYNDLVLLVLNEIGKEQEPSVLATVRKRFQQDVLAETQVITEEITSLESVYTRKAQPYVIMKAINITLGTLIAGGLVGIGVLGWMIDHCPHSIH